METASQATIQPLPVCLVPFSARVNIPIRFYAILSNPPILYGNPCQVPKF
jgi:hypothetical protein